MSRPELVESQLGDEPVVATVSLAGEDTLVVTPTRSLLYRSEGLISDESVEEFPHGASRLTVDEGRRKAKITFEYPIDDPRTMSVPANVFDTALHYVLAGVLNAGGVTADGETVRRVFRFNELTLVITDRRLVTHVGSALWDDDYDEFAYADITGLEVEEGSLATQIALYMGSRSQRIKAPHDRATELKQELTGALIDYFDVDDATDLDAVLGRDDADAESEPAAVTGLNLSGDIDPIGPSETEDPEAPADVEWPSTEDVEQPSPPPTPVESDDEPAADTVDRAELESAIRDLEAALEQQHELLAVQREAIEALAAAIDLEE